MLFGNQVRLVLEAFSSTAPSSDVAEIVRSVVRDVKIGGTRGFDGVQAVSPESIRTKVDSDHPELSSDVAARVAAAAMADIERQKLQVQVWMRVIISAVALTIAGAILLTKGGDDNLVKWATGLIGMVVGYWLS